MADETQNGTPRLSNAPIRTTLKSPREAVQPEAAPPPPPAHRKARNRTWIVAGNVIFTLLVIVSLVAAGGVWYGKRMLSEPGPSERDTRIYIPRNSAEGQISEILERSNVISSPLLFRAAVRAYERDKDLKWGEYDIPKGASMADVINILVEGKAIKYKITIPEGLTSQQIVARLQSDDVLTGDVVRIPKEGSLAPDTYAYQRGDTRQTILDQMTRYQTKIVADAWAKRAADLPVRSPDELVTLASIVEKETGIASERPRVAGVFVNRLNKRMRLESDPTIIYGLVGGKGSLGRGILRSEIDRLTPYNTYRIDGLPPTPIANPGKAAIEATANPMRHKEIFFVADGTGGHVFAETLDQHNRNVARWRQIQKDAEDKAPATPAPATVGAPATAPAAGTAAPAGGATAPATELRQ